MYGVEFRNENNIIQIDSSYGNYYLRQSGAASTTAISGTGTGVAYLQYPNSWLVVTVTGVSPIIAFRCSSRSFLYNVSQSGSNWTFTIATFGAVGTIVNYYIYDVYPTAAGTGWGMEIYDASGKVTFSSERKYMRVVDVIQGAYTFNGNDGVSGWNGSTYSYAAGRSYAILQSHLSWGNQGGSVSGNIVCLCSQAGGSGFSLHDMVVNNSGRPYVEPYGDLEFVDRVTFLVLDVTNH